MPFLYASVAALLAIKEARIVRFYKWNCCFTSKLKLTFSNNNWGEQRTSGIFCTAEKPWIWWCPRSINSLWGCCVRGVDDSLLLDIPLCHFVPFFITGKQCAALCNLMAKRHELVSLYTKTPCTVLLILGKNEVRWHCCLCTTCTLQKVRTFFTTFRSN